jgi:2,5-diamino-6-(ribosylamino)-4(3H)-pyrimidinone 5'-phosphate reductase
MSRHVIVHAATSLDGATTEFQADVACFYELASRWSEDITLAGADTILAQEPMLADAPRPGPKPGGPLLAVVDGRRRVSQWEALRECGHWRDVVGLHAEDGERVDLAASLARLEGDVVRVDSGGGLNGALLRAGLVDEVSLLVHPCIVGGGATRWYGSATGAGLRPVSVEQLQSGLVWLRYRVDGRATE